MRHRITTLTTTLIATALTCTWLTLAAFPSIASACVDPGYGPCQLPPVHALVVHETTAPHNNSNATLPIALASGALLLALAGTGYAIVRTTQTRRRVARHGA
jgi:hypothetical protein